MLQIFMIFQKRDNENKSLQNEAMMSSNEEEASNSQEQPMEEGVTHCKFEYNLHVNLCTCNTVHACIGNYYQCSFSYSGCKF